MIHARWSRVAEVFEKALDAAPSEREAMLRRECGDDLVLLRELQRLLENDARAAEDFLLPGSRVAQLDSDSDGPGSADDQSGVGRGPFPRAVDRALGTPASDDAARPANAAPERDPFIGRRIGHYTLKRLIARGGMGAVYLAEQKHPSREVALKIMTAGFWSRSAQRRFEFESELLGRLHHPHIAQVYESSVATLGDGVEPSVPFFAMEYIPGARPVTQYCNDERLDLRARLELFCTVCDAVQHGHQQGVVHRDLKPANILIDEHGHAKVIDFGVARSTDSDVAGASMHTETGALIGTLAYMSPEQSAGRPTEIDTRSDVYSLGVVLFEFLTDKLPYDVSHLTLQSAARVICEQPPGRPSAVAMERMRSAGRRGDLDTIVLKCLEKDRAKRYASMDALADDVRRWLRGEPTAAHPPTVWARAVRWAGRHPVCVTAGLCGFVALATLTTTSASVWYLSLRPAYIVRIRDGRLATPELQLEWADEAQLLARNGNVLHHWGGPQHSIGFADLVDRPEHLGGGRLVIIAAMQEYGRPYAGSLCAYDVDGDLNTPIWNRRIEKDEILPALHEYRNLDGEWFHSTQYVLVEEVFDGNDFPGPEIICTFACATSQRVIRIYDLGGNLLYECWHDGCVQPIWMPSAHLLVCAGDDHQRDWNVWGESIGDPNAPQSAFALRPSPGSINRDTFINSDSGLQRLWDGGSPAGLIWYKWLYIEGGSAARTTKFVTNVMRPYTPNDGKHVGIMVTATECDGCGVNWTIDARGEEVSNSRMPSQVYRSKRGRLDAAGTPSAKLPDPNSYDLRDRPPVRHSTKQPDMAR